MRLLLTSLLFLVGLKALAQPLFMEAYPDTLDKKRFRNVIITEAGTYAAGLFFLAGIWYKDKQRVPFHFYDDSKGYLQQDKWGHAYGAYYESYTIYYAFRRAGLDKRKALLWGGPAGLIFQTPIEIFDGLYEGWGFSWSDMAANTLGAALFTFQEALWEDQFVKMKFSYSPSPYPKYYPSLLGETALESFFLDYNGHTYWLSANLKNISGLEGIPPWLNIAFGYSGNGMIKEFENPAFYQGKPLPFIPRYRQFLLSMDLDLTKVPARKIWVRTLFKYLNLVKVPFPALEWNRLDKLCLRPLYF